MESVAICGSGCCLYSIADDGLLMLFWSKALRTISEVWEKPLMRASFVSASVTHQVLLQDELQLFLGAEFSLS